jgi:HlyD family secretion protein
MSGGETGRTYRGVVVAAAAVVVLVAAVFLVRSLMLKGRDRAVVLSGTVEADDATLGSLYGGRVEQVLVHEGDRVKGGALLVLLETRELDARRAEAAAGLDAAQARLDELRHGYTAEEVEQAKQEWEAARATYEFEQAEFARIEKLLHDAATTTDVYDKQKATRDAAQHKMDALEQRYLRLKAGPRPEEIAAADAEVARLGASLNVLEAQLEEARISAPFDGVVEDLDLRPGDMVPPARGLVRIVKLDAPYVRAYVPEGHLGLVQAGTAVTVRAGAVPGEFFEGVVRRVATTGEYTPRNLQTPSERAEQVFRFDVDLVTGRDRLRPGMAAEVLVSPSHE